ncbi:MAG TPA: MFS transporter [Candidatus Limnocylindrales bacterium]|nr:MFS transporter [Candidatus Limnocylindrales bacterium]
MIVQSLTFSRDRFTWLAYFMLAYYAYMQSALGPLMPFLAGELNMSYTVCGLHISAFALGMIIAGSSADRVAQRFGRTRVFWVGGGGMALAGLILIAVRTPALTIAASFGMGVIGSYLLVVIQAALSDRHGSNRGIALTEANVCASVSSMMAPLLISQAENIAVGWRIALLIGAGAWLLLMLTGRSVPITPEPVRTVQASRTRRRLPRLFWVLWGVVFLSVAVEWSIAFWAPDFLERVVGVDRVTAAGALTFFYMAAIFGRLAGSRLTRRLRSDLLLVGASAVVVAAFPVFWLARTSWLALGALFVLGLGIANLFPLSLSAATTIGADMANTASARVSLAGGLAILIVPQVLGSLADQIGIQTAFLLAGLMGVGVLTLSLFAVWAQRQSPGQPA